MESNYLSWINDQAFTKLVFFYELKKHVLTLKKKISENESMVGPCLTFPKANEWKVVNIYLLSSKVSINI